MRSEGKLKRFLLKQLAEEKQFQVGKTIELLTSDCPVKVSIICKNAKSSGSQSIATAELGSNTLDSDRADLPFSLVGRAQESSSIGPSAFLRLSKKKKTAVSMIEPLTLLLHLTALKGVSLNSTFLSVEIDSLWTGEKTSQGIEFQKETDELRTSFIKTFRLDQSFFEAQEKPLLLKFIESPLNERRLLGFVTLNLNNVSRLFLPGGSFHKDYYYGMKELAMIDTGLFEIKDIKGNVKGYSKIDLTCGRPDLLASALKSIENSSKTNSELMPKQSFGQSMGLQSKLSKPEDIVVGRRFPFVEKTSGSQDIERPQSSNPYTYVPPTYLDPSHPSFMTPNHEKPKQMIQTNNLVMGNNVLFNAPPPLPRLDSKPSLGQSPSPLYAQTPLAVQNIPKALQFTPLSLNSTKKTKRVCDDIDRQSANPTLLSEKFNTYTPLPNPRTSEDGSFCTIRSQYENKTSNPNLLTFKPSRSSDATSFTEIIEFLKGDSELRRMPELIKVKSSLIGTNFESAVMLFDRVASKDLGSLLKDIDGEYSFNQFASKHEVVDGFSERQRLADMLCSSYRTHEVFEGLSQSISSYLNHKKEIFFSNIKLFKKLHATMMEGNTLDSFFTTFDLVNNQWINPDELLHFLSSQNKPLPKNEIDQLIKILKSKDLVCASSLINFLVICKQLETHANGEDHYSALCSSLMKVHAGNLFFSPDVLSGLSMAELLGQQIRISQLKTKFSEAIKPLDFMFALKEAAEEPISSFDCLLAFHNIALESATPDAKSLRFSAIEKILQKVQIDDDMNEIDDIFAILNPDKKPSNLAKDMPSHTPSLFRTLPNHTFNPSPFANSPSSERLIKTSNQSLESKASNSKIQTAPFHLLEFIRKPEFKDPTINHKKANDGQDKHKKPFDMIKISIVNQPCEPNESKTQENPAMNSAFDFNVRKFTMGMSSERSSVKANSLDKTQKQNLRSDVPIETYKTSHFLASNKNSDKNLLKESMHNLSHHLQDKLDDKYSLGSASERILQFQNDQEVGMKRSKDHFSKQEWKFKPAHSSSEPMPIFRNYSDRASSIKNLLSTSGISSFDLICASVSIESLEPVTSHPKPHSFVKIDLFGFEPIISKVELANISPIFIFFPSVSDIPKSKLSCLKEFSIEVYLREFGGINDNEAIKDSLAAHETVKFCLEKFDNITSVLQGSHNSASWKVEILSKKLKIKVEFVLNPSTNFNFIRAAQNEEVEDDLLATLQTINELRGNFAKEEIHSDSEDQQNYRNFHDDIPEQDPISEDHEEQSNNFETPFSEDSQPHFIEKTPFDDSSLEPSVVNYSKPEEAVSNQSVQARSEQRFEKLMKRVPKNLFSESEMARLGRLLSTNRAIVPIDSDEDDQDF